MADDDPIRRGPSTNSEDQPTVRGLAAGRRVFSRYVLETPVGRGGMGVVWRAHDEELDRKVALKFLPEVVAGDAEAVRDLKRETKRCLELTHSNIVRVYDFVQETPMAAIAMELVDGQSLAKHKIDAPGGCLSVAEVTPLATQLCAALDYAHRTAKVVHRDLKPANLLVTRDGHLKVTDFGIARSLTDTHTRLTGRAGDTSGTLVYMSPQQLMGKTPTVADDIYTLGATLYDLLTGKPPFFSGDIVTQVRELTPPALAQRRRELEMAGHLAPGADTIPPEWEETIRACLEKEPEDRPQSVAEVARRMGLGTLEPEIGIPEAGPAGVGAAVRQSRSRDFGGEGRRPTSQGQVPAAVPPPASGNVPRKSWLPMAAAAAAVLVLIAAGYYFGVYAPGRRASMEAAKGETETKRAVDRAELQPPAATAVQTEREQRDHTIIMTLISATADGSPQTQVDAADRAVQVYLNTAPEQYRADVTAAWFKRRAGWEEARLAGIRENAVTAKQPLATEVRPAESAAAQPVNVQAAAAAAQTEREQRDHTIIMTLIGATANGSPRAQVDAADRAVQSYLGTAPERFRADVTAAWFKRRAEWDEARLAGVQANAETSKQGPATEVRPVETTKPVAFRERRGGPEATRPWTVPDPFLEMVWIQPGAFEMGSPSGESGRYSEEGPQTKVTLTMPFWLGKTEVTQAQWKTVMRTSPSNFKGDNLPVEKVSWAEAMDFCRQLTRREQAAGRLPDGYEYTLPTEAQWEYACRAGAIGAFAGEGKLGDLGWYADNSGNKTHPGGQKRPNAWGLFDMHGNVWEWCRDWYGKYPGGDVVDYNGPAPGSLRVARGGGWCFVARNCRSARRSPESPGAHQAYLGFRLALASVR